MLPAPECAKTSARYAGDCMICAAVESDVILDIQADIGLQRYWKVLRNVTARLWRHEHVRYCCIACYLLFSFVTIPLSNILASSTV